MDTNETTMSIAPMAPAPLAADDLVAYEALHHDAVFLRHQDRHWSRFTGARAAEVLNGLVTNDVNLLATGSGHYAAALTPKGKMLADLVILRTAPESFLVGATATGGAAWWGMVRKFVNPRLVQFGDESADFAVVGVYGPAASRMLARLGGAAGHAAMLQEALEEALNAWPLWQHAAWNTPTTAARLVRVPELGDVPGFLLLVDTVALDAVLNRLETSGATPCTEAAFAVASIESGRPLWSVDMDDSTIPQEANLDLLGAVSFSKGCYTGQETVARIHFRGHVNRHLRGLRLDAPVASHTAILDASGKVVGETRRTAVSPKFGPIATAMVRREVEPGSRVTLSGGEGPPTMATVVALPFAAS